MQEDETPGKPGRNPTAVMIVGTGGALRSAMAGPVLVGDTPPVASLQD